jgi:hypothetical protein
MLSNQAASKQQAISFSVAAPHLDPNPAHPTLRTLAPPPLARRVLQPVYPMNPELLPPLLLLSVSQSLPLLALQPPARACPPQQP